MDKGNEYYRRFLQGDTHALADIVELYNERLISFLNGYLNDWATAQDIAADTFLHLLVKKPSFKQEASFKVWLFRIAKNKATDHLRRKKRYPEISLESDSCPDIPCSDLPELYLLQNEDAQTLYRLLRCLAPHYRTVLQLLYFEDMSYRQIAAVMRKNEKQIKNIAFRAREQMKKLYEKEENANADK